MELNTRMLVNTEELQNKVKVLNKINTKLGVDSVYMSVNFEETELSFETQQYFKNDIHCPVGTVVTVPFSGDSVLRDDLYYKVDGIKKLVKSLSLFKNDFIEIQLDVDHMQTIFTDENKTIKLNFETKMIPGMVSDRFPNNEIKVYEDFNKEFSKHLRFFPKKDIRMSLSCLCCKERALFSTDSYRVAKTDLNKTYFEEQILIPDMVVKFINDTDNQVKTIMYEEKKGTVKNKKHIIIECDDYYIKYEYEILDYPNLDRLMMGIVGDPIVNYNKKEILEVISDLSIIKQDDNRHLAILDLSNNSITSKNQNNESMTYKFDDQSSDTNFKIGFDLDYFKDAVNQCSNSFKIRFQNKKHAPFYIDSGTQTNYLILPININN